ncbi:MAG: elongation factor 1-beta [Candidatus Nanoarchaeia archaeon]|nr:elongation factor 1-beta [Candidatus Nanoarchaeia archaeon]
MANVIVTIRVMPETPEVDLGKVLDGVRNKISEYGKIGKHEVQPIAFGLKALVIYVIADESKGSPDPVCEKLTEIEGVQSAEAVDVRREVEM